MPACTSPQVITVLIDAKDWEQLMEQAELLMKKRSQMKQVQSVIVQEAIGRPAVSGGVEW